MENYKYPLKAVYLNVIIPGLGCAYLRRWGYAILFLIWTPVRLVAGAVLLKFVPFSIIGNIGEILHVVLLWAWWAAVMYDTCKTPYKLAEEHNMKHEYHKSSVVDEEKQPGI